MIVDASLLPELMRQARAAGKLALDTEFMGEGRYRTLLCLVQLAVPGRIELLDPLDPTIDGSPLAEVLADPSVEVVVHAGRQDVALLRRWLSTEVRNVFDTQVAAGFAGMGAQSSYETLLGQVLGMRVAKSASFTRWDARPLSQEQLGYAREDVLHLLELAQELQQRLTTLGRLQWARQECEVLERASDERDLENVFARLPRVRNLSLASQAIARELVQWREETAAAQDRPVQSVLGDPVLVEIAKRKPSTPGKLHDIRGAGQSGVRRRTEEVLDAVRRGLERPHEPLEETTRHKPPDPEDAPLVALAEALVRARTREADLAYELLAARADLQAIVGAWRVGGQEADVRTLKGWRRELVGAELLKLLGGEVTLSVGDGRLRIH
ncbi:MAG TPA: HRDC domain-containing protein [Solirubrobacteraceae bacterium]|jgi:ribonuclease D|nr:HRDC domain-containing protein [Solirubrobacteraceae bacterium]